MTVYMYIGQVVPVHCVFIIVGSRHFFAFGLRDSVMAQF